MNLCTDEMAMHDLGLAARWCSRLVLLDQGVVVADGSPRTVLTAEHLRTVYSVETYLGEAAGSLIVQPLDIAAGPAPTQTGKEKRHGRP